MTIQLRYLFLGMLVLTQHTVQVQPVSFLRGLLHLMHNRSMGITPLHLASLNGNLHSIMIQFAAGESPNARDNNQHTPLHCAAFAANSSALLVLTRLTGFPVDLEAQNHKGQTPLHIAVIREDVRTIKTLLALGANKEAKNHLGLTPLYYAKYVEGPHSPIVGLFLSS